MYKKFKLVALVALVASVTHFYLDSRTAEPVAIDRVQEASSPQLPAEEPKKGVLGVFSGLAFSDLYSELSLPNTTQIVERPSLTGSDETDDKIYDIAEERGYVLQSVPSTDIGEYDGVTLQEYAIVDWEALQKAAAKDGHNISIRSGYRDLLEQKQILLERLAGDYSTDNINSVLETTAPPGYSRHHTGYTVDLMDSEHNVFEYTGGYEWMSSNNYENAKKFGFIPSYPEGVEKQCPNPEAWEFIWVGKDAVRE